MHQDVLLIIPCSKAKIWDKNPTIKNVKAKDAYISTYFKLCKRIAEITNARWLIFSAKYGLIPPEFVIPNNYDVSFNKNCAETVSFFTIYQQMVKYEVYNFNKIYSFCGKKYNKILENTLKMFKKALIIPFPKDMRSIGKRQRWIKYLCTKPYLLL